MSRSEEEQMASVVRHGLQQSLAPCRRAYKSIVPSRIIITKPATSFQSHGLPARATLTATLESRGINSRGCKAVPGPMSSGWVYLTEEIRLRLSIPGERCLRRKGPAGYCRTGAASMTTVSGLSQPQRAGVTRCRRPCQAGSPLFSSPVRAGWHMGDSSAVIPPRPGRCDGATAGI
jgi:hypothetical protein